jgi:hypothetical protein
MSELTIRIDLSELVRTDPSELIVRTDPSELVRTELVSSSLVRTDPLGSSSLLPLHV